MRMGACGASLPTQMELALNAMLARRARTSSSPAAMMSVGIRRENSRHGASRALDRVGEAILDLRIGHGGMVGAHGAVASSRAKSERAGIVRPKRSASPRLGTFDAVPPAGMSCQSPPAQLISTMSWRMGVVDQAQQRSPSNSLGGGGGGGGGGSAAGGRTRMRSGRLEYRGPWPIVDGHTSSGATVHPAASAQAF